MTTAATSRIGCDTKTVTTCPTSFKDMLTETGAEGYKIGINNSPLTSNSALAAVQAAAVANGGSLDNVAPGVKLFRHAQQERRLREHHRRRQRRL